MQNKILGGLYGQALGDAFGMPGQVHPDDTKRSFGWLDTWQPAPDDHIVHAGLPAGRITDDSEQAFSIAQAVIKAGGVTIEAAVDALITWYERVGGEASPYVGPSTKRGLNALKNGDDPNTTGLWGDTNGAPMRISPIGLLHCGDIIGAVQDTVTVCKPTHFTQPAVSGACAVSAAIAIAMLDNASLSAVIQGGLLGAELGREYGRKWFGTSVTFKIQQAIEIASGAETVETKLHRLYYEVGTTLNVPETVGAAFGVMAMANGDPKLTAIYAANLSGDADTVGAIACAMAGTFAGFDAFDPKDIAVLENDEVFQEYKVRDIATGLEALSKATVSDG